MFHVTRDQAPTVFFQWFVSTNLFCKWRFFALSSASWTIRQEQLNSVLKPVKLLSKPSNWLIRIMVALPLVVLICIDVMLGFETEGRTWKTKETANWKSREKTMLIAFFRRTRCNSSRVCPWRAESKRRIQRGYFWSTTEENSTC